MVDMEGMLAEDNCRCRRGTRPCHPSSELRKHAFLALHRVQGHSMVSHMFLERLPPISQRSAESYLSSAK